MKMPNVVNRVVLTLVAGRRLGMDRMFVGLAVRGRRSGTVHRFPVQYAEDTHGLVVVPGDAEHKTWWRNLRGGPTEIEVLVDGTWTSALAELVFPGDEGRAKIVASYRKKFAKMPVELDQPVVLIALPQHQARTPRLLSARSRSTVDSRLP